MSMAADSTKLIAPARRALRMHRRDVDSEIPDRTNWEHETGPSIPIAPRVAFAPQRCSP